MDYALLKETINDLDDKIILISGHQNADYDSICGCLALATLLNKLGRTAYTLIETCDMEKTSWLNNKYIINNYTETGPFNYIMLDANRKSRLGIFESLFDKASTTITIDHHEDNRNEANYNFVDENISSVCEIIYNLSNEYPGILDKEIASFLYGGIASDTNSFYKRTTPYTMMAASKLLEYGVDATFVIKHTCKNITIEDSYILSDMIKNIKYDDFHYIVLDRNNEYYKSIPYNTIFKKCASYIYEIIDISVLGIFLIELDGSISGLLRSNCDIDIDTPAKQLGGGGHKKASGFETNEDLTTVISTIKNHINNYK